MKKTIASLALFAAGTVGQSANAMIAFPDPNQPQPQVHDLCVTTYKADDNSEAINCDASRLNKGKKLKDNGCAAGQIALRIVGDNPISSCLPPGAVQL